MTQPRYLPRSIVRTILAPAAGAEVAVRSDTGALWVIRSIVLTLVTDATAVVRVVMLTADDASATYFSSCAGQVQNASLTRRYGAYSGSAGTASNGGLNGIGLPDGGLVLPQGHTLRTATENLQAADAYGATVVMVDEYPTGSGLMLRPTTPYLMEASG